MQQPKKHFNLITIAIASIIAIGLLLCARSSCLAQKHPIKLHYIGEIPDGKPQPTSGGGHIKVQTEEEAEEAKEEAEEDTISNFDIFKKFEWDVQITSATGATRHLLTTRPDTIDYTGFSKVLLATDFIVDTSILMHPAGLRYELNGSVLMTLNNCPILATGNFNNGPVAKYCGLRQQNITSFYFRDTANRLEITYLPHPKMKSFYMELKMGQYDWAQEQIASDVKDNKEAFALGSYYLSFGIVFLILFVFYKEKTENLYFALFCLFASFSWLAGVYETYSFTPITTYSGAFSLEFLSIFFAKTIKNKKKTKIPLIIMAIVAIASFHPAILYNYTFFGTHVHGNYKNVTAPIVLIIIFGIFYSYAIGSSIKYLIKGFKQKSWEAKTIVYICTSALAISYILPGIVGSIPAVRHLEAYGDVRNFLGNLGLCVYPLSAAIVLGRRNSLNQRKLAEQLQSIEHLSVENLAKEKEKKQILENQNTELEIKVTERTHEVLEQKQLIETKNQAITENLVYAQRIQSALLPDVRLIGKPFNGSFVLYLPKDIVSGDFYSFSDAGNQALVIAGDCTGHGVSGAFMSMIGSSLLTQIINEQGIENPAQILNSLNAAVIDTLKQTRNDSNDGMDIAACLFDFVTNELTFAGANRPLWLVRDNAIEVIKPDKFPIGGLQVSSSREFKSHVIKLQPNDVVYLSTDGYADQFGGEKGKKMMTAKFKETLLAIQHMDMGQQHIYLHNFFQEWKGAEEQVDDVLVIGIKV
jgi:serine phosphatase RsbU (regulator of sigma subunit)